MTQIELDGKLVLACNKAKPDLYEIEELIIAGADTNQVNKYNDSIFDNVFLEVLYEVRDDSRKLPKTVEKIKEVISLMIDNGFDVNRFGISTMSQFKFATYDSFTFELYRFMLQYDLADDPKAYEEVLEGIGCEESYQRCCEHDHDLENLFYAIYEMVEAKMEGRDYKSIEPYYGIVGLTIDKIIYFSDSNTMVEKNEFTEYNADIGFVCGDKLFVIREGVNILFMNDRTNEKSQVDISSVFGKNAINRKIKSVSFDHKDVIKGTTHYGQPIIIIELTNGKKLNFTHNFGELTDKEIQSRFWIE